MSLTRRGKMVAAAATALLVGGGALGYFTVFPDKAPAFVRHTLSSVGIADEPPPPPPLCPLSGVVAPDGKVPHHPALAVKVENAPESRPQAGLNDADVVVEERVEGGYTRFIAVYQCGDSDRVGPVRSGRTTDPDYLRQLGPAVFGYAGAVGIVEREVGSALQILDSLQIPIHFIAGTSMGSIAGGLYALGYSGTDLGSLVKSIDWTIIFSDKPPREKLAYFEKYDMGRCQLSLQTRNYKIQEPSGLIFGQKISLLLTRMIGPQFDDVNFDQLPIPFRCVAADLITGNEMVLSEGSLPKAIRASMSVPSIFTPVTWGDSLLVDGGVLNNLPSGRSIGNRSDPYHCRECGYTVKIPGEFERSHLNVEQVRGQGTESFTGTLLSTQGGLVLKRDDGTVQIVPHNAGVKLPSLPGGLITRPTLVWDLDAQRAGKHRTRVSYQTQGMTWWADYNVTYAEGKSANECKLDVGAWVSIVNQSGAGYADAKLKLVAGDVHRPQTTGRVNYPASAKQVDARNERAAGFEEQAFFEYHLYTLGRATTLPGSPPQSTPRIQPVRPRRS